MNRELIYSQVFGFFNSLTLGGTPAFVSATRNGSTWEDTPPEECPALLFNQESETAHARKGLPTLWTLNVKLLLYVITNQRLDPTIVPTSLINPLLDMIETALKHDDLSNDVCTLGGLVSHAYISGTIVISEGNLGNEAVASIPINILVPASA